MSDTDLLLALLFLVVAALYSSVGHAGASGYIAAMALLGFGDRSFPSYCAFAKAVAAAISDTLVDADLTLSRGRLVGLWFERATARRSGTAGSARRIDLRFRARVEDY